MFIDLSFSQHRRSLLVFITHFIVQEVSVCSETHILRIFGDFEQLFLFLSVVSYDMQCL